MSTLAQRITLAAGITIGLAFGISAAPAMAQPAVAEDSPAWDCIFDGNRVCGPLNAQGAQPGCYNDHAALVAAWPCHVVTNPDGSSDVYTGPATNTAGSAR